MNDKKTNKPDISITFDQDLGQRTDIQEKYTDYYAQNPEKQRSDGPDFLSKSIDHKTAELYRITKEINEHNSLKEHKSIKHTVKLKTPDAKKVLLTGLLGSTIAITSVMGVTIYKKVVEVKDREAQYQNAVSYMNKNVMPEVLQNSGFKFEGIDGNCNFVYDFDAKNILAAKEYLMYNYGFTDATGELAIAEYFDFNDNIYIVRGKDNSYDYYSSIGYQNKDAIDDLVASPERIFVNMNQTQYQNQVESIMNNNVKEGDNNARS